MREPDRALTVRETTQWAGVSHDVIRRWITHGRLAASVVAGKGCIRLADVRRVHATVHLGGVVPARRADPARAGIRLRMLCEAQGWNQQHLAARSGLTHEAISNLEHGKRSLNAATIRALADALEVRAESFVDDAPLGLTLLTVAEAAMRLDVPARRMRVWLRRGMVEGTKLSSRWRVLAVMVAELEHSGRLRGPSRRRDPRYRGRVNARAWPARHLGPTERLILGAAAGRTLRAGAVDVWRAVMGTAD